ncbi:MAG: hypothetical protein PHI63_05100 [Patescibacteria group bacterium]|nr:hypothetical protein [Patescibacteria group bacterium]
MIEKKISHRCFLVVVGILLAVFTSQPYLYGWLHQTPDLTYLGLHGFAPGDTFVYYSYLWQVRDGHLMFTDLFTTEAARFPMLNTFWTASGLLGQALQLSVPLTFHLARLLTIPLLLWALWALLGRYLPQPRLRRWGVVLAAFGSGVSGYLLPFFHPARDLPGYYPLPLDLWVPESNIFLSVMHSGHMAAAFALIMAVFCCSILAAERRQVRWSILAGVCALGLFSFHPFHAPLIFLTLAAWAAGLSWTKRRWRWDIVGHLFIVGLAALPVLVYYAAVLAFDPVTAGRAARNLQLSPPFFMLVLSYGFLLPGAAAGTLRLVREQKWREPAWLLLLTWALVQAVLVVMPLLPYQRRLTTGLTIPLAILTVYGLPLVLSFLGRRWLRAPAVLTGSPLVLLLVALPLFGFSNLVSLANDIGLMQQRNPLLFWPHDEVAAITAVRRVTDPSAVVLAGPGSSYLIAGLSGRQVVLGHDVETLNYERKKIEVAWFFRGGNAAARRALVDRYGVTHVYSGAVDYGDDILPLAALPWVTPVYANASATIYRVNR